MSTLKELFSKHGSVWLSDCRTPNVKYFKPVGFSENGEILIGELHNKNAASHNGEISCFVPYVEPKKLVKKWLWRWKTGQSWTISHKFHTEKEALEYHKGDEIVKCEWSEILVDE